MKTTKKQPRPARDLFTIEPTPDKEKPPEDDENAARIATAKDAALRNITALSKRIKNNINLNP